MTTYFEANNNNQKTAINDTDKMLCLSRCGNIDIVASKKTTESIKWGGYNSQKWIAVSIIAKYTITLASSEYLVAVKPPNDDRFIFFTEQPSESVVNIIVMTTSNEADLEIYTSEMEVFVFGESREMDNVPGIQVFNADGELVFKGSDFLLNVKTSWNYITDLTTFDYWEKFNTTPQEIITGTDDMAIICCANAAGIIFLNYSKYTPGLFTYGYQNKNNVLQAKPLIMAGERDKIYASYLTGISAVCSAVVVDVSHMPKTYPPD